MMPLDVADHFRGTVSIWASLTSIDGSRQTTFDDSTPVHKQLIDIKYSKDTRKQFKPGLPYKGKVRQQKLAFWHYRYTKVYNYVLKTGFNYSLD